MRREMAGARKTAVRKAFGSSHFAPLGDRAVLNVVLYHPEIPPNTGNVIRLCANTGTRLHLVGPLGFELDDARLRRAGLDYHELADVHRYRDWAQWRQTHPGIPLWAFSTRGSAIHTSASFHDGDGLLFGPESRGLPDGLLEEIGQDRVLRLPMRPDSRSLNLSNAVAVGLFEALRQMDFPELD